MKRSEARELFLAYWTRHGRRHFRLEEELLFPERLMPIDELEAVAHKLESTEQA